MSFNTINVKALCPSLQYTVVNVVLGRGIGESETKWQAGHLLAMMMRFDELLKTVSDVLPQFIR